MSFNRKGREIKIDGKWSETNDKNFFRVPGLIDDPYQTKFYHINNADLEDVKDGKRTVCDRFIKSYRVQPEKKIVQPVQVSSGESFYPNVEDDAKIKEFVDKKKVTMTKDEFISVLNKSTEKSKKSKVDPTLFNVDKVSNFGKLKSRDHKWLYPAEKFDAESRFDLFESFPKVNSKYARHKVHVNMKRDLGRSTSESRENLSK